jgi:glutamine amidotransferase
VRVVLADYGGGNLRSLCSALVRAGAETEVTADPVIVREAPLVLIAGVGNVASAAAGLALTGLDEALRARSNAARPIAGVCVGLQLLFEESDEGGLGLGLLAGPVCRLQARCVPHMGWNTLTLTRPSAILGGLDGEDVYFAHSFAVKPTEVDIASAIVDHDGEIVAAVETGWLAGLQFHPERSGAAGAHVLDNLLQWSRCG